MRRLKFNFSFDVEKMLDQGLHKLKWDNKKLPRPEILSLYWKAFKFMKEFDWEDHQGVLWRERLRQSIRKEFEGLEEIDDSVYIH